MDKFSNFDKKSKIDIRTIFEILKRLTDPGKIWNIVKKFCYFKIFAVLTMNNV